MNKYKKILLVISLISIIMMSFCSKKEESENKTSEPKVFKWYEFSEALKIAKEENKLIFVDFYADWCFYCKKMDNEVFSKKEIQDLMINNFIPVKINAEGKKTIDYLGQKQPEYKVAAMYLAGGHGLPTYMFIDKHAKVVNRLQGFQFPDNLRKIFNEMLEVKEK